MTKRWIVMLCLLTLGLIPAAAQDPTSTPLPENAREQQWIQDMVETVEIQAQDDQPVLVISGTLTGTCEPIDRTEVHREGIAVFVDLYRTLNPAIRCLAAETPFEMTVPVPELLELDDDHTLPRYVIVNDKYYEIAIAQVEPVGDPPAVPPMTLTEMSLDENTLVKSFEVVEGAEFYEVHVTGLIANGCPDPVIARVFPTPNVADTFNLQVFRLVPYEIPCPTIYMPEEFEVVIATDQPISEPMTVIEPVKDVPDMPPTDEEATFRSPHTIENIDVLIRESAPPQYIVHVEGYQSDGCDFPVEITQTRAGNTFKIEIFRVMPLAVICPMNIVQYSADIVLEGTLEAGDYTVDVNGTLDTFEAQ